MTCLVESGAAEAVGVSVDDVVGSNGTAEELELIELVVAEEVEISGLSELGLSKN